MNRLAALVESLTDYETAGVWQMNTTTTTTRRRTRVLRSSLPLYRSQAMKAVR